MPRPQLTILLNTFNKQHPDGKCRDIFYAVEGGKKVCQRRKPQEIIKYLRSVDVRNWVNAQEPITSKREIERLAEQTETYIIIYEQTDQNEARILGTFGEREERTIHIVAPYLTEYGTLNKLKLVTNVENFLKKKHTDTTGNIWERLVAHPSQINASVELLRKKWLDEGFDDKKIYFDNERDFKRLFGIGFEIRKRHTGCNGVPPRIQRINLSLFPNQCLFLESALKSWPITNGAYGPHLRDYIEICDRFFVRGERWIQIYE